MTQLDLFADTKPAAVPEPLPKWSPATEYREGLRPEHYDRGHCWFYYLGGIPLPVESIEPCNWEPHRPIKPKALDAEIASARKSLADDIKRYRFLAFNGGKVSDYDSKIAGNRKLATGVALSLKHNHISYGKGRLKYLLAMKRNQAKPVTH